MAEYLFLKKGLCRDAPYICVRISYIYIWCINNKPYLWHAWGTIRGQQAWGCMTSSLSIGTIIATYSTLVFSKTDFYSRTAFTLFYWIYSFVVEILQNGKKIKIFNYIFINILELRGCLTFFNVRLSFLQTCSVC